MKNYLKFHGNAYGGSFGKGGRLLVAGDDEANVRMFDTNSKHILRSFKGHSAAVHRTFFTSDQRFVTSFSDDKTVKIWDISEEKLLQSYENHKDYIRAGCVNPVAPNLIASGGYDNIVNVYDLRTQEATMQMDHGSHVESLLFVPSGGLLLSAGGTEIRVWDIFSKGKLLMRLSNHHKTITCLQNASNGKRFLSGSLDRHVKIYDISTYQVVHTLTFPNSVLSLGIAPNDQTVVAGMVDGYFSVQNMERKELTMKDTEKSKNKVISSLPQVDHEIPDVQEKRTEAHHDQWLRKYEYVKALDYVMRSYVTSKNPHVTVSVLQELIRRKGLKRAILGKKQSMTMKLCRFIAKYIGDTRFTRVLIDVANDLVDLYEDKPYELTGDVGKQMMIMNAAFKKEIKVILLACEVKGMLDILIASKKAEESAL